MSWKKVWHKPVLLLSVAHALSFVNYRRQHALKRSAPVTPLLDPSALIGRNSVDVSRPTLLGCIQKYVGLHTRTAFIEVISSHLIPHSRYANVLSLKPLCVAEYANITLLEFHCICSAQFVAKHNYCSSVHDADCGHTIQTHVPPVYLISRYICKLAQVSSQTASLMDALQV